MKSLKMLIEKINEMNRSQISKATTTTNEQRATPWMTFESLADFLNPSNSNETCEGYPAPIRAIFTASI